MSFSRPEPPAKTAVDYTDAEKAQFEAAFGPVARRYRASRILSATIILPLFFLKGILGLVLFIIGLVIVVGIFARRLLCPACGRDVTIGIRTFCPECGGEVEWGGLLQATRCLQCQKTLSSGRRRSYKIRCCTHCGVFLDDQGI